MKKWMKPLLVTALSLMLTLSLALPALAAAFQLKLPVTVALKGPRPTKPETFQISLTALSPDAPMPQGSQNGTCILKLSGAGEASFPAMDFDHPMKVRYRIHQIPGSARYYTYDPASYELEIFMISTPQGLAPEVIITKAGQEEKAGEIRFENRYDPPPENPENPRMGDDFPLGFYLTTGTLSLAGALVITLLSLRKKDED